MTEPPGSIIKIKESLKSWKAWLDDRMSARGEEEKPTLKNGLGAIAVLLVVFGFPIYAHWTYGSDQVDVSSNNAQSVMRGSPDTKLNEAWAPGIQSPMLFADNLLSVSGYPIVVVTQDWVACENPFTVQEATDAMKIKRLDWVANIPGCTILFKGLEGEWTRKSALDDIMELRFEALGGGRPITLYGAKPAKAGLHWLGILKKKTSAD